MRNILMGGYFSYKGSALGACKIPANKVTVFFFRQRVSLAGVYSLFGGEMDIHNKVPIEFDNGTADLPNVF